MLQIEMGFPATYDVRVLDELPAQRGLEYEFVQHDRVVDGGILISVISACGRWDGMVANASNGAMAAHSGIHSTPSPSVVAVVARGDAYFIDVESPDLFWVLEDSPVVAVRSAVAEGLLVFATPRRVVAVGRGRVAWRTPRLAIDGIHLAEPAGGEIAGIADPGDEDQRFVIDLESGSHRGGLVFPPDS